MKTAVEWLANELHGFIHPEHGKDFLPILEQAKEMEKSQIIQSHLEGQYHADGIKAQEIAQDYYNETFKSE